ncbi:MAG: MBL fold metallo-hydrolase [Thermoplasmata archaeon]|jgi:glyoxylase-like metal-dependent hydrolase (beta-lactamase superfamily II)
MASVPSPLPHPFLRPPRVGAVTLIAPKELEALLRSDAPPFLVDVRPAAERAIAHLPNDRHVPLERLAAEAATFPRDRPLVMYDHLGSRARDAAEYLERQGFERAAALEGGLDEYARIADPSVPRYPVDAPANRVLLRQLPRPEGCLSYFVGDLAERVALVIDPGRDEAPYRSLLAEGGWRLAAIVETHTHADHLAGHARLHAATGAPIYVSHRSPAEYPHRTLTEGEAVRFGTEEVSVLETPGHTRDHLTLRVRDRIFTGDTLLLGSCGRTDLGGGSPELLWESLQEKLLRLPAETEVYPAHYGPRHALPDRFVSTLGFERARNEALLQPSREAFLAYMSEGWPPKPTDFDRIVRANLAE